MKIETVNNELEKLKKDKEVVDSKIAQYEQELVTLRRNSDMLSGAIQTCNFFIKNNVEEPEISEESAEETSE